MCVDFEIHSKDRTKLMQHKGLTVPKNKGSSSVEVNSLSPRKAGNRPPAACDVPIFLPYQSVKSLPTAKVPPSPVQLLLLHHFDLDYLCHVYKVLREPEFVVLG